MALLPKLSPALRFRFTEADDIDAYGDRWWTWDEKALVRTKGRQLIVLEETVGLQLLDIINGLRVEDTRSLMAAQWISMQLAGADVAWDDFNPAALLCDWEEEPERPLDSGEAAPTPDSSSSAPPVPESATS